MKQSVCEKAAFPCTYLTTVFWGHVVVEGVALGENNVTSALGDILNMCFH